MNKKVPLGFVALLLVVSISVFYYGPLRANTTANPSAEIAASYQNISAKELNAWLTSEREFLLIDVRELDEFNGGHLQGAFNIPLGELENRLKEIPRDQTVVVYCRSGRRSAEAANILAKNDYIKVINLEGGIINWTYEVVKQQATLDVYGLLNSYLFKRSGYLVF